MHGFASDIRYALRRLRRGGIPIAVAVLSLAVGIGANTAMFSVGYTMLIHPLPYGDADRLVMLRSTNPSHGALWTTSAPANLLDWQAQAKSFAAMAGYRWRAIDLIRGDRSERLHGLYITPEFFKVLQVSLVVSLRPQPWHSRIRSDKSRRSYWDTAFGNGASVRTQLFSGRSSTSTSSI